MSKTFISEFQKYYGCKANLIGNQNMFEVIKAQFPDINDVIYPGSYIDIQPSFIFQNVTYVDSAKMFETFFNDKNRVENEKIVIQLIEKHKKYETLGKTNSNVNFLVQDYTSPIKNKKLQNFDLVISLYAGFVSQGVKKYLRHGGYLLAHDSFGDATKANLDVDFKFIGVLEYLDGKKGEMQFSDKNLENHFKLKKNQKLPKSECNGPKYIETPVMYVFQKIGKANNIQNETKMDGDQDLQEASKVIKNLQEKNRSAQRNEDVSDILNKSRNNLENKKQKK